MRTSRSGGPQRDRSAVPPVPGFRPDHVLVHYDEIMLKGRNRGRFEKRLSTAVHRALRDLDIDVRRTRGRIVVDLGPAADPRACLRRLRRVPGVTTCEPVARFPSDLETVGRWLEATCREVPAGAVGSFRVACRRSNKSLPYSSMDVNRDLGARVQAATGWPVRIHGADLDIHVRLVERSCYVGFERLAGTGGLPPGSTGKVACLLSGGIDSPVAAHHIQRRGAWPVFVHFHSAPHTSTASQDKVRELTRLVLPPGHRALLWMVAFGPLQQRIILHCPPSLRVLLYRRFMLRCAEAIGRRDGALATITGDSLGQVASQTLENLGAVNAVATLPVLRPLIGLHKAHIVADAQEIGTYDVSVEPHDDCCSFLMPKHPATAATADDLELAEAALDVPAEVQELVESAGHEVVRGEDPGEPAPPRRDGARAAPR